MNLLNSTKVKKLAGLLGVASITSLMSLPVFAQLAPSSNNFNRADSNRFSVAEKPLRGGAPSSPGDSPTTPASSPSDSSTTPDTTNSESSLSEADRLFIIKAAQDGIAEVQLGQLALERGVSDTVKQYAQEMVDEHTQANKELAQLATQKGVTLPEDIGEENKALMERLSALSGTDFDQAYMTEMVNAHTKVVSMFEAQTQEGQDSNLKAWTAQKLPTLQEHLNMASEMAQAIAQPDSRP